MAADFQKLRLKGVYQMDKQNNLMLRVKVPAGLLSSEQAQRIALLSRQYSNGVLHLTSRGSIEFHWLRLEQLEDIFDSLEELGLTTRGACGGAVRGISCSTTFSDNFVIVQRVAQRFNMHFSGNPDFEGLPKKFKVSVDAGYLGARHLIQDIGLVFVDSSDGNSRYDVWCAGGLGREPQAAFLLEEKVSEESLVHLIEAVVQVYRENTPPPKRLKYLLNEIGQTEFRSLLRTEMEKRPRPVPSAKKDVVSAQAGSYVEFPVFAGEIQADRLESLAAIAKDSGEGLLAVTTDQNIVLLAPTKLAVQEIKHAVNPLIDLKEDLRLIAGFRVCPGSHECRMGIAPTRDVTRQIMNVVPLSLAGKSWALSGCRNSCSQPQLADYGIVTKKLFADEDGSKQPLFDLFHRDEDCLGRCIADDLTLNELITYIQDL